MRKQNEISRLFLDIFKIWNVIVIQDQDLLKNTILGGLLFLQIIFWNMPDIYIFLHQCLPVLFFFTQTNPDGLSKRLTSTGSSKSVEKEDEL